MICCRAPFLAAVLLVHAPTGANALTAEEMEGLWESADGKNNTCAKNPARLSVTRGPDQVIFDWQESFEIFDGSITNSVTYQLLEEEPGWLDLAIAGDTRMTDNGTPVVWVLRPDADRNSFCWGRTDWPESRCDHSYRRCADPAPTS